jgi:hypothetical protein
MCYYKKGSFDISDATIDNYRRNLELGLGSAQSSVAGIDALFCGPDHLVHDLLGGLDVLTISHALLGYP